MSGEIDRGNLRSKMEGLRDMFAGVDEAPDPTVETSRPGAGRGLAALSDRMVPATPPPPSPGAPKEDPPARARSPKTTARRVDPAAGPRRKTSLSIPHSLRAGLSEAFTQQRWTFAQLADMVATRLTDGTIAERDISVRTRPHHEPLTVKTVNLKADTLETVDSYAAQWRYSRSQLMATALAIVIDDL